jgi:hypothetical protein
MTFLVAQDKLQKIILKLVHMGWLVSTKQVPNLIIFGYEIILAFEIKAFKV